MWIGIQEQIFLLANDAGGGFNTFGFLSMMIAGYNLVGLISNNGNQNNNNNDNNDNINNNNNQVWYQTMATKTTTTTTIILSEMEVAPHPHNSWYHTEHKSF